MKRLAILTGILALAFPLAQAQTSTWTSDPAHSEVDFSIKHMGVSNVHGRFGHVTATIAWNEADITKSTVTATIDVVGVNTGESARDNHLKTDTFFDATKFPSASFVSTSVAKSPTGLTVSGNLTIKGVTKPVILQVDGPTGPGENPMDHKLHAGYEATTTVSRLAFGIGSSFPDAILSDAVKLTIDLDTVKQ
jgi:polyisoprenoid-binding protein YceI